MRTRLLLSILALSAPAFATTHSVLPGNSIQAKIDIAVAGDIVAIFGGTYNEDLTINKAIRLVEVSGQDVTLTGSILFTGVTDCPPLEGFNVGSAGRGITLTNTTGMVLRNLVGLTSSGVAAGGSSTLEIVDCNLTDINIGGTCTLKLRNTSINNLTAGGTTAEVWNTTIRNGINQTAGTLHTTSISVAGDFNTQTAALKTVAFRTTVAGNCLWRTKRSWLGYSKVRGLRFTEATQAKLVVVGCEIDRQGEQANGIHCNASNSSILIANNSVIRVGYNWPGIGYWELGDKQNGIDISGLGNKLLIVNNYCHLQYYGQDVYGGVRGDGIYVREFEDAKILNNIIVGAKYGISAPFGVVAKNNLYWASPWPNNREANGVVAEGTIYADPLFVANEAPKLQPESPCINAGTSDPRYNDRDSTRNDIGPSGGAWFDPDGWTTENPVVISFDLLPDQVLEGVDTEVILSEGQAVSVP
jgi:hypothetical protein